MKNKVSAIVLLALGLFVGNKNLYSQCFDCFTDKNTNKRYFGFKKSIKKQCPRPANTKWYKCTEGNIYGVEDFKDSTKTYVFSADKKWLATETRYMVTVPKFIEEGEDSTDFKQIKCPGPDIIPPEIEHMVAEVFHLQNLDTLNTIDGAPFWVCDLYKVELAPDHPVALKEKINVLYVANMDFILHFYTADEEIIFESGHIYVGGMYYELEYLYE